MIEERVQIELTIDVNGHLRPVRCRVREAASELTHAVVEIATGDDVDFEPALGSDATLSITVGDVAERRFTLVVGAVEFLRVEDGAFRYEVHLHARPWLLGHTRATRKFRGLSAKDIVSKVLGQHGVAHAWHVEREPRVRNYCVEYAESDLDFVSRLLEFEGIYYTFDERGTMLLADRSSGADPVDGGASFELLDAAGAMSRGELGIFAFQRTARVAPGRVTVNDFDWKNPKSTLIASREAERQRELEVYDYPAGYRAPAEGELLARMRLEAHRASASWVEGAGNLPSFTPGRRFELGAAGGGMFAGEYFLVAVEHEAHGASFHGDEGAAYKNSFRAIAAHVPYRPEANTPTPNIAGCHTAMVRGPAGQEIHTDKFGRFRAQFHWDREAQGSDQDSRWIRLLQETATSMNLARVGWEMSVAYIDGDPDRPVGFARNINSLMPPAYGQPGNKTSMAIKTPSSPLTGGFNEIKLDDSAGSMMFYVRAEKDYSADVKHDKTETIGHDEARTIDHNLDHAVGRDQTVHIGHDSTETIEKNRTIEVKATRAKTIGGSEDVKVDGAVSIATAKDETEEVGSMRFTFAGGFKMPDLAARAQSVAKGLVPSPSAIATKAGSAAMSGAASTVDSAIDGGGGLGDAASTGASGALAGATGSLTESLSNLVPSPSGIASQLTGGLSDGLSIGALANNFLVGSIRRTATQKTSRLVGGAFISAGIGDMTTTSSKAYIETVGGLKLTTSITAGIAQSVGGMLTVTVGGAIVRTATKDIVVSAKTTTVTVGAALALQSAAEVRLMAPKIEITGLTSLDLVVSGAGILIDADGVHMKGAVQIKAGSEVVFTGPIHHLA